MWWVAVAWVAAAAAAELACSTDTRWESAARKRPRRNGFEPALARQSGHSWAQPSRSLEPRVVHAAPHHRQSKVGR